MKRMYQLVSGALLTINLTFAIDIKNKFSYLCIYYLYLCIFIIKYIMNQNKKIITSVKIPDNLYEDFKIMNVRTKMNLQDLVERSIYMYLVDPEYRKIIHEQYNTYYTGSDLLNAIK